MAEVNFGLSTHSIRALMVFVLMLVWASSFGQITITNIDSIESRCEKSGSLRISTSGGSGGTRYGLIAPSQETRSLQSSSVFNALGSGKYTVRVVDNSGKADTATVSVPGNYQAPQYSILVSKAYCKGKTGKAKVKVTGGRAPYSFRITSGPLTRTWQTKSVLDSLPSGVYGIEAKDSCGFLKNVSFTIQDTNVFQLELTTLIDLRKGCDSFRIKSTPEYGISPYSTDLRYPNGNSHVLNANPFANYTIHKKDLATLTVYDRCNDSVVQDLDSSKELYVHSPKTLCSGVQYFLDIYYKKLPFLGPRNCMKYGALDTASGITKWNSGNYVIVSPNKGYKLMAVDTCCRDTNWRYIYHTTQPISKQVIRGLSTNIDSTTGIQIAVSNFNVPSHLVVLETPFGINDSFTTSRKQIQKGPLFPRYTRGDTIATFYATSIHLSNLPSGKYKFELRDTCGNKDTVQFEILNSHLYRPSQKYNVIQACPSAHKLAFEVSNNQYFGLNICKVNLSQISPVAKDIGTHFITRNEAPGRLVDTFTSLSAGTYILKTQTSSRYNNFMGDKPGALVDTVIIADAGYPAFELVQAFGCKNAKFTIIADVSSGLSPHKYRIKRDTSSVWTASQDSGIFLNVNQGIYDIEVTDACNNVAVTSTSGGFLTAPKLSVGFRCDEDSLEIFGNEVYGVTYRWTKDGSLLSNSATHRFTPYSSSDHGEYELQAFLGNSQGICVDTTVAIKLSQGVEFRNANVLACDSVQIFNKWRLLSGVYRDTLSSSGGCDSISATKLILTKTEVLEMDSVSCDSALVFGAWVYSSGTISDTVIGMGLSTDTLAFNDFESSNAWTLNGCGITSGEAQQGTYKLEMDDDGDWIELPPLSNPQELSFYYRSDSIENKPNQLSIEVFDGSSWNSIKSLEQNSTSYEHWFIDLSPWENSKNLRVRIRLAYQESRAAATDLYLDNVLVTKSSIDCDSIIRINLTLNKAQFVSQSIEDCDSSRINGKWYYMSGTIRDTLQTDQGCDSMVTTDLTINNSVQIVGEEYHCDSVTLGGVVYYNTHLFTETYSPTPSGCDSIGLINHIVQKSYYQEETFEECDSILFEGDWYFDTEELVNQLTRSNGCDSVLVTNLIVHQSIATEDTIEECDSAYIHGQWYFNNQLIQTNLNSSYGCDSTVFTDLTIKSTVVERAMDTLCIGRSYELPSGQLVRKGGVYSNRFVGENLCDSIVELELNPVECPLCSAFIPSAISLRRDELNDVFRISGNCEFVKFKLILFNRWGEKIYETSDPAFSWDGHYKGAAVQNGVYMYLINYLTEEGIFVKDAGLLNVLN